MVKGSVQPPANTRTTAKLDGFADETFYQHHFVESKLFKLDDGQFSAEHAVKNTRSRGTTVYVGGIQEMCCRSWRYGPVS